MDVSRRRLVFPGREGTPPRGKTATKGAKGFRIYDNYSVPREYTSEEGATTSVHEAAKQTHIAEQVASRVDSDCCGDPGRETVAGFGIALYRAAADYLESNRDALIAELRAYRAQRPEAAE